MSVSDSMRLTYADFKKLPKMEKRMLLHRLPYEDFMLLTEALKKPITQETREMESLTLQEMIRKQRS